MPAPKIQCAYDGLAQLAEAFSREAWDTESNLTRIVNLVDQLRSGGWSGEGAEAFFAEIDEIMPKVKKLIDALELANTQLQATNDIFQTADSDLTNAFKSNLPRAINLSR
jgi:WXG100 family type VII secretion target